MKTSFNFHKAWQALIQIAASETRSQPNVFHHNPNGVEEEIDFNIASFSKVFCLSWPYAKN